MVENIHQIRVIFAHKIGSTSGSVILFCDKGPVFTKGLRLSQVLRLNPVLKLRLLSQLRYVLKPYSQRVT